MKILILLTLLPLFSLASEEKGLFVPYLLEKSERDSTLSENESVFEFQFKGIVEEKMDYLIHYSIDGIEKKEYTKNGFLTINTKPGTHAFKFFYTDTYFEVYIDSVNIKPGYRDVYSVYFENSEFPVVVDKPVIYLYPTKKMQVEVSVNAKGENVFEYPTFNNLKYDLLTWKTIAEPNGTIHVKNKHYNYLFWEAEQTVQLTMSDLGRGFVVKGSGITAFLEEKLDAYGLTSQEKADFITYWGPRIVHHNQVFIHFITGDECNRFAEYIFTPKPDHVNRLYMMYTPVESGIKVMNQVIEPFNRDGFSVIEWGGFEYDISINRIKN